jgi:hypothetical protein
VTDHECELAFNELRAIMNDSGLSWAATQVIEEIRFGRTSRKSVRVRQETTEDALFGDLVERSRTSRITVSATQPFTPKEQLSMLLKALERAVVEVHEMKDLVRKAFTKRSSDWTSVRLVRTDEDTPNPIAIKPSEEIEEVQAVIALRVATQAFRRAI